MGIMNEHSCMTNQPTIKLDDTLGAHPKKNSGFLELASPEAGKQGTKGIGVYIFPKQCCLMPFLLPNAPEKERRFLVSSSRLSSTNQERASLGHCFLSLVNFFG